MTTNSREKFLRIAIFGAFCKSNFCKKAKNCEIHESFSKKSSLYSWAMSQILPVNNFDWIKDTSQFNRDFTKNYNEEGEKDIFLKLMLNILKNNVNFIMIYYFYLKE